MCARYELAVGTSRQATYKIVESVFGMRGGGMEVQYVRTLTLLDSLLGVSISDEILIAVYDTRHSMNLKQSLPFSLCQKL